MGPKTLSAFATLSCRILWRGGTDVLWQPPLLWERWWFGNPHLRGNVLLSTVNYLRTPLDMISLTMFLIWTEISLMTLRFHWTKPGCSSLKKALIPLNLGPSLSLLWTSYIGPHCRYHSNSKEGVPQQHIQQRCLHSILFSKKIQDQLGWLDQRVYARECWRFQPHC